MLAELLIAIITAVVMVMMAYAKGAQDGVRKASKVNESVILDAYKAGANAFANELQRQVESHPEYQKHLAEQNNTTETKEPLGFIKFEGKN